MLLAAESAVSSSGGLLGMEALTWQILTLVLLAALAAGWIDAVVGGGGLIQLPALLLVPGISPVQALATNKLASICGTATSSVTYYRRARPDLRTALPMAGIALGGSLLGAFVATVLPVEVFKPIIVVALVIVAVVVATRPRLGSAMALRHTGATHLVVGLMIGLACGFYDGVLGPGTGTFLVISMVGFLGYNFLQASAKAKIVNFATNLGALLLFIPYGAVLWGLGLLLGAANLTGSYLGSRMAVSGGSGFIRVVFLVVVFALILTLGADVYQTYLAPRL